MQPTHASIEDSAATHRQSHPCDCFVRMFVVVIKTPPVAALAIFATPKRKHFPIGGQRNCMAVPVLVYTGCGYVITIRNTGRDPRTAYATIPMIVAV